MNDMIVISAKDIEDAFEQAFIRLYDLPEMSSDPNLIKEAPLVLTMDSVRSNLKVEVVNGKIGIIDNFLVTDSSNTSKLVIDHYNTELFRSGKVEWLVNLLKKYPSSKRAIINIWNDPKDSIPGKDSPCVIYFWFRIEHSFLELHTHMRANDAFRKFMLNLEIFIALHRYIAAEINYTVGRYVHIVDSFHFYKMNTNMILKQVKLLKNNL